MNILYRQQGFSLIELLIAAALGSLIAIAALSVFSGSSQLYIAQKERGNIVNDAAYVLEVIGSEIANAGYSDESLDTYLDSQAVVLQAGANGMLTNNNEVTRFPARATDEIAISFRADIHDDQTVDCLGTNISDNLQLGETLNQLTIINHYYLEVSNEDASVANLMCQPYVATHISSKSKFITSSIAPFAGQSPQPLVRNISDFQILYGVARGTATRNYGNNDEQVSSQQAISRVNLYVDADNLNKDASSNLNDNVLAVKMGVIFVPENTQKNYASETSFDFMGSEFTTTNTTVYVPFEKTIQLRNSPVDIRDDNAN